MQVIAKSPMKNMYVFEFHDMRDGQNHEQQLLENHLDSVIYKGSTNVWAKDNNLNAETIQRGIRKHRKVLSPYVLYVVPVNYLHNTNLNARGWCVIRPEKLDDILVRRKLFDQKYKLRFAGEHYLMRYTSILLLLGVEVYSDDV